MPIPRPNALPSPGPGPAPAGQADGVASYDPLAEAETLRDHVHNALARATRLVAALKHQRRQTRALNAAVASLRQLDPGR
jgi:hypothetical protein